MTEQQVEETVELTRGQKAARTRARNKAKREKEAAAKKTEQKVSANGGIDKDTLVSVCEMLESVTDSVEALDAADLSVSMVVDGWTVTASFNGGRWTISTS